MTVLLWQDFATGCYEASSDRATHVPDIKVGRTSVHWVSKHTFAASNCRNRQAGSSTVEHV